MLQGSQDMTQYSQTPKELRSHHSDGGSAVPRIFQYQSVGKWQPRVKQNKVKVRVPSSYKMVGDFTFTMLEGLFPKQSLLI